MKNKEKRNDEEKKNKKESELVTKESLSAAFGLFSLLALLILCTRSFIFGDLGQTVHAFLTGVFGYCAFPLTIGALYLSVTSLIGKRFVKNRRLGLFIACAFVCVALIVHIATTFSWNLNGYVKACFYAGENFPAATVMGWVGALFVFVVSSLISKVGALVLFSLLLIFFVYLSVITLRASGPRSKKTTEKFDENVRQGTYEIPYSQPVQSGQNVSAPQSAPVRQQGYPSQTTYQKPSSTEYGQVRTPQRPGVMLGNEGSQSAGGFSEAFSPFGTPNNGYTQPVEQTYDNNRDVLFGTSPAENFRRNLIFDPNAKVNKRSAVDPHEEVTESVYTPSYSESYQNSLNEENADGRPVKIFTDNAKDGYLNIETATENHQGAETQPFSNIPYPAPQSVYDQPEQPVYEQPSIPLPPLQPIEEERPVPLEPVTYTSQPEAPSTFIPTEPVYNDRTDRDTPSVFEKQNEMQNIPEQTSSRRNEYLDLFSSSNPNVMNRDAESDLSDVSAQEEGRGASRDSDWHLDPPVERGLEKEKFEEIPRRDGLNLFDDEPQKDPYSLQSEYDEAAGRTSGRNDDVFASSRNFAERNVGGDVMEYRDRSEASEFGGRGMDTASVVGFQASDAQSALPPEPTPPPKPPRVIKPYVRVSLDDLDCRDIEPTYNSDEVETSKENILQTLSVFNITGASIASVTFGPTVTRYNVALPLNVKPGKVLDLSPSIAIGLRSSGVNIYPNYEDGVVSIELPNKVRQFVQLGCMLSGDTFVNANPSSLMFAMGKDVANRKVYGDISKMIHLLVAGASGAGKSVFLNSLIISLIYKYSPEELRLILIDPKKTEFVIYDGLPHLMINEIITTVNKAIQSLEWAIAEMNRRYEVFAARSKREGLPIVNIDQYNARASKEERLSKIVIIIDELADLMLAAGKDIEDRIQNLAQKARAAGIHLIVATQRPSKEVITGVIKSNLPTRVAFAVPAEVDSRVILDQTGAHKLLGKGDMLYVMSGVNTPIRVQSAFISDEDSRRVVNFIKANNEAYYDEDVTAFINGAKSSGSGSGNGKEAVEEVYIEALRYVILSGSASISLVQRKCSTGYNKAGKIIEWMEEKGYISAFEGAKARKVLITKEQFEETFGQPL